MQCHSSASLTPLSRVHDYYISRVNILFNQINEIPCNDIRRGHTKPTTFDREKYILCAFFFHLTVVYFTISTTTRFPFFILKAKTTNIAPPKIYTTARMPLKCCILVLTWRAPACLLLVCVIFSLECQN